MRNLPRIALVPLAVLVSTVPFTFSAFVGPAGADTAADCEAAFNGPAAAQLTYTTDPVARLAYTGQTVGLYGAWDPAAWDSLTSATACVRLDDSVFDESLGASETAPDNSGAFSHSFVIPEETDPGTRLCTRIRLAGDPAGEATEAVWASKEHCFEVDHQEEEAPPVEEETTTTTAAPSTTTTTTTTAPADSPANSQGAGDETPPSTVPAAPESPAPPFDSAGDVPGPGEGLPTPSTGLTPENLPLLPATGYASLDLVHHGELLFFTGLGLLALGGRRRRTA